MTPTWLLETDTFLEGNPQRMADILRDLAIPFRWVKYIPFDGGLQNADLPDNASVVVYGSLNLARYVLAHKKWIPGIWADAHALRCSTYYVHWSKFCMQKDYAFFPLGVVAQRFPELAARFGEDDSLFLRPNENDKSFSGALIHTSKFDRWYAMNAKCYDLDPTQLVIVAKPQTILSEHRFIVADRQVITGSKYKIGSELRDGAEAVGFAPAARAFAQHVLDTTTFQPHRIFVLDIAETPVGYAVMEIGSVNSCGLYGCDLHPVITHATRIATEDFIASKDPPHPPKI